MQLSQTIADLLTSVVWWRPSQAGGNAVHHDRMGNFVVSTGMWSLVSGRAVAHNVKAETRKEIRGANVALEVRFIVHTIHDTL